MYAITFDLKIDNLREYYKNDSINNAYKDIKTELEKFGFENIQGSTYFGNDKVNAVTPVLATQALAKKFDWFSLCVRDIRMLRIEENNDLLPAIQSI